MSRPAATFAIVAAATILLGVDAIHAAPGDLDGPFGTGGVFAGPVLTDIPGDFESLLTLDHLDRPILGSKGSDGTFNFIWDIVVTRVTASGTLDESFNPTGPTPGVLRAGFGDACTDGTTHGPRFKSVTVTPDHHIVVAATLCNDSSATRVGLMRVDENGAFDTGFDGDGRLVLTNYQSFVNDIAVDSSERIYVAGGHCVGGGPLNCSFKNAFVTRITKEGTRDVTFNATGSGATPGFLELAIPNISAYFNAIEVLAGDRLVAVGRHDGATNDSLNGLIARISADGHLETSFGPNSIPPGIVVTDLAKPPAPGGTSIAEIWDAVTTDNDESVLVTGQITTSAATCPLAKLTSTGALDTSFASTATVPGITTLPGATTCRKLLLQPDGKIVAIGWGPKPLGPGMGDTNQVVIGRFDANGVLDSTFGVGGVVKTPIGAYAIGEDGALQSDGKILVAGVRRAVPQTALDHPYVARYIVASPTASGGATPTPTASGSAQNPTPTPTATPVDQPGEICGNCLDDESDGYLDRDDPECGARANGGGQGLGNPKVEGKAVLKCAKAIAAAGAKLGAARLAHLQRCVHAVFACLQGKPGDSQCLAKAGTNCTKHVAAALPDRTKLRDAITKVCAVPALPLVDLKSAVALGYGAESAACLERGVATLGSVADVTECVRARTECAAEQLLALQVPRAAELMIAGGRNPAVDAPCLPAAGVAAAGLGNADRARAAVKCAAAVQKAASKFAGGETKTVQACLQAATACVQLKPGDADCITKLRASCAKKIAPLAEPGGLEAKLAAAIAKDCGGLDATELGSADGLGYAARSTECVALGAAAPTSAAAIADCLRRQHECHVAQGLEATTPRAAELLDLGQATLP